ncbi:MAG TPA: thioesterase II family protein [Pyrinomonadaceae bacterium]|nr:thioesterase II family protein [Pyrinomonadaceae bacterium]
MLTTVNRTNSAQSPWLAYYEPNPRAKLRLFCFPYAGGSALVFHKWRDTLPPFVEVCPVQLPGRGNRLQAAPFTDMDPMVEAAGAALLPYFNMPFAFFGHSMGASISFELARLLRREGRRMPLHLYISGRRAPHIIDRDPPLYNLPDAELLTELRHLNGTPKEVLEHPELMTMMLPLLRADFSVAETYVCKPEAPLDVPMTVFGGLADKDVTREDLEGWQQHSTASVKLRMLAGDHFFLNTSQPVLLRLLSTELNSLVGKNRSAQHDNLPRVGDYLLQSRLI